MNRKQITIAILKPSLCSFPERLEKVYQMIQSIGSEDSDVDANLSLGLKPILRKPFVNWNREEVCRFYGKFVSIPSDRRLIDEESTKGNSSTLASCLQ
jgi:hypothetical protein